MWGILSFVRVFVKCEYFAFLSCLFLDSVFVVSICFYLFFIEGENIGGEKVFLCLFDDTNIERFSVTVKRFQNFFSKKIINSFFVTPCDIAN